MGRGARVCVTLRSMRVGVPSLSIDQWVFVFHLVWPRWIPAVLCTAGQSGLGGKVFASFSCDFAIHFMGRIHPVALVRYKKNKSS